MTQDYRIHKDDLRNLINEMRHDAELEAWQTPEKALEHYADRLESYQP